MNYNRNHTYSNNDNKDNVDNNNDNENDHNADNDMVIMIIIFTVNCSTGQIIFTECIQGFLFY